MQRFQFKLDSSVLNFNFPVVQNNSIFIDYLKTETDLELPRKGTFKSFIDRQFFEEKSLDRRFFWQITISVSIFKNKNGRCIDTNPLFQFLTLFSAVYKFVVNNFKLCAKCITDCKNVVFRHTFTFVISDNWVMNCLNLVKFKVHRINRTCLVFILAVTFAGGFRGIGALMSGLLHSVENVRVAEDGN